MEGLRQNNDSGGPFGWAKWEIYQTAALSSNRALESKAIKQMERGPQLF